MSSRAWTLHYCKSILKESKSIRFVTIYSKNAIGRAMYVHWCPMMALAMTHLGSRIFDSCIYDYVLVDVFGRLGDILSRASHPVGL